MDTGSRVLLRWKLPSVDVKPDEEEFASAGGTHGGSGAWRRKDSGVIGGVM